MSNINWNQFTNNFLNNFNQVAQGNVQNSQQVPVPQGQTQQNTPYIAQPFLPQTTMQLSQTVAELAMLNQQQTLNMLKDLLQMPKNFEQLLTQLVTNPTEANQKIALLLLASNLNTSQLSSLLQNNSKEAMTNMYKMLAQFNQLGMSLKDEQLSQLSKMISFVAASSTSDVQSIRTTMLMYLPWLPLTDPNAFKLEIANGGGSNGEDGFDYVTILISTENYGNIQVEIYKLEQDSIKIEFNSSETFPQNEFVELMKEENKKYSVKMDIELAKKEAFNKEKNESTQTQVFINAASGINPFLLLISNAVIKNVHTIDSKENLREQRKEKIENGES